MRFNTAMTSDRFDRRMCQLACFIAAPMIFTGAVLTLQRFATTPAELLTGVLAAGALAISIVVLGIVTGPKSPAV